MKLLWAWNRREREQKNLENEKLFQYLEMSASFPRLCHKIFLWRGEECKFCKFIIQRATFIMANFLHPSTTNHTFKIAWKNLSFKSFHSFYVFHLKNTLLYSLVQNNIKRKWMSESVRNQISDRWMEF